MNDVPKIRRTIRVQSVITLSAIGAFFLVAVLQRVALFADGAYLFYRTVGERSLPSFNPRIASEMVLFGPLWMALQTPIDRTIWLELIFGVSVFAHFVVMLVACQRASRFRPELLVFPVASFVLLSANMGFWPFTGSHVVVSVFWSLLFVLVIPKPWTRRWMLLSIAFASFAMFLYESMLFLGPILVVVALWRAHVESDAFRRRGALLVALLCIIGVGVAFFSVLDREAGHFTKSSVVLFDPSGRPYGMLLLSLWALVLVAAILWRADKSSAERTSRMGIASLAIGCLGWLTACLALPDRTLTASVQHDIRSFNLWITLGLFGLFIVALRRNALAVPQVTVRIWRVLTVMAIAQTVSLIIHTAHWNHFLGLIDHEVSTQRGRIAFESTALQHAFDGPYAVGMFVWGWTMPVLSLLAARDGSVRAIIANPVWESGWAPLTLADTVELRDPERYGYRLEEYLRALPDSTSAARP